MKLSSIIGKLAGFVGARFLGAGLGFLSQIALARLLPVADVGIVFLAMSAAAFISLAVVGGYALLAMTEVPRFALHGRKALLKQFNNVVMREAAISMALSILIVFAIAWSGLLSEGQTTALLFGCLCVPASGLLRYNSSLATADRRIELGYVPDFLVRPALFLAVIGTSYLAGWQLNKIDVLLAFVFVTFATAIGQAWLLGPLGLSPAAYAKPRLAFAQKLRPRAFAR